MLAHGGQEASVESGALELGVVSTFQKPRCSGQIGCRDFITPDQAPMIIGLNSRSAASVLTLCYFHRKVVSDIINPDGE
jgi:hypothetical protein